MVGGFTIGEGSSTVESKRVSGGRNESVTECDMVEKSENELNVLCVRVWVSGASE